VLPWLSANDVMRFEPQADERESSETTGKCSSMFSLIAMPIRGAFAGGHHRAAHVHAVSTGVH
jgi:hypothetical protein